MRSVAHIMGMPITIEVVAADIAAERAVATAFEYFRHVDETFSTYKPTSQISRINRGELSTSQASLEVRKVLQSCVQSKQATDGYFDIQTPRGIDPSGYVKGWAIHNAADQISKTGISNFCISAGGDIQAWGHNEQGKPWRVGIQHPTDTSHIIKTVDLHNQALATSGTYERGQHIYNPHTGKPVQNILSLSVLAPSILEADVLATAAFARGSQGICWLAEQGIAAYMVTPDLQGHATANWPN